MLEISLSGTVDRARYHAGVFDACSQAVCADNLQEVHEAVDHYYDHRGQHIVGTPDNYPLCRQMQRESWPPEAGSRSPPGLHVRRVLNGLTICERLDWRRQQLSRYAVVAADGHALRDVPNMRKAERWCPRSRTSSRRQRPPET